MNIKKLLLAIGALLLLAQPMSANRWDVNGDGHITAGDVTAIYDYLLNGTMVYGESAYDVNRDGHITAGDITALYDALLNGVPSSTTEYTVNGVTFVMVSVDGGTFTMGVNAGDPNANDDEIPNHQVTLSDFAIGQTEVTQELWLAVMGFNYSGHGGNLQYPAEYMTWELCQVFISKLNEMTGKSFRLPTEAEWEFAARGGNMSQGYLYSGSNNLDDVAWYEGNSGGVTHAVGTKAPNELGLYDMSGNVWEWCSDWYAVYSAEAQTNPAGPESGAEKVMRGGSWCGSPKKCRVSKRFKAPTLFGDDDIGLRLAL
jgi:formylglycine-generating enzyme required for sulfatase activity